MKNNTSSSMALEKFKIFPYIAWGLIVIFAVFVYNIALELQSVTNNLGAQSQQMQLQIDTIENKLENIESSENDN